LRGHRIHIENMAGLEQMPRNGGWIVVGGVRNEGRLRLTRDRFRPRALRRSARTTSGH
jgi:hypothetical protein